MKVYEYVIVYRPESKDLKPEIIAGPTVVLAKDDRIAQMVAVQAIPENYKTKLQEVEITVRPF